FIEGAARRPRAAQARGVEEACPQVEFGPFLEPAQPVIDGLPTNLEQFGDLGDLGPVGDPEQGLGATSFLGHGCAEDDTFQFAALPVADQEPSHRFTLPVTSLVNRWPFYLSKNFWHQDSIPEAWCAEAGKQGENDVVSQ